MKLFYRFIKEFYLKYWFFAILILILMLCQSGVVLAFPYFNKILIDDVLTNGEFERFYTVLGLMVLTGIMQPIISAINDLLFLKMGQNVLLDMRKKLINHIIKLSPKFFDKITVGEFLTRIESDVRELQQVSGVLLVEFIANVINTVLIITVMFTISVKLTSISIIMVLLYMFTFKIFGKKINENTKKRIRVGTEVMSNLSQIFSNIKTIQLFNKESWARKSIFSLYKKLYDSTIKINIIFTLNSTTTYLLAFISTAVLWLIGGQAIIEGALTIGTIIQFSSYQSKLFAPLRLFASLNNNLNSGIVALERIYNILEYDEDNKEQESDIEVEKFGNSIEFKNVNFEYSKDIVGLNDVSFKINKGEAVGIVGASGCGKSTLLKLLTRLYKVDKGEILIDNKNINHIKLTSLRSIISTLEQKTAIFNCSIRENILLSEDQENMESIKEFFKSIDMEEYINSLPDKYETILGENGNNLSGGQKKSISIGRAMLRDFQILLLDEATTSLDNNRKEHLLKVIRKFRGEKTIVMVTHDISDVEDFDKIIVMDKGKIIGLGNHKDLLKQCDAYNKLFYKNGKITA